MEKQIRIVSGGSSETTKVYFGDEELPGVVDLDVRVSQGGIVLATITFAGVALGESDSSEDL